MKTTAKQCPYCRGTGTDPRDPRKTCQVCQGRKKIKTTLSR